MPGDISDTLADMLLLRYTLPQEKLPLTIRGCVMATTKQDLIDRIAESTGTKRTLVKAVVQDLFDEIIAELAKGNRLEFRDFGVFETKTRPARIAQNPRTLEKVKVPAKRRVMFKPGRLMREGVNGRPL
jgi:nucleoid DNA-binding protein